MSDKTFKCKICKGTFRVKALGELMSDLKLCPQCYTKQQFGYASEGEFNSTMHKQEIAEREVE